MSLTTERPRLCRSGGPVEPIESPRSRERWVVSSSLTTSGLRGKPIARLTLTLIVGHRCCQGTVHYPPMAELRAIRLA
jgi:hypothetical protein